MKDVCDLRTIVSREEHVASLEHIHLLKGTQDIRNCETFVYGMYPLLKDPVEAEGQEACEEVCGYAVFSAEIYRPCLEFRLHYPETFLDLPSASHDIYDLLWLIVDNSLDKRIIRDLVTDYFVQKFYREEKLQYNYDFIDLFCGAGGLSVGLEHEGFRPVAAVDNNKAAITTYKFNSPWLGNENIHEGDIRELLNLDIFSHVPLIVGGPPCQGFSIVNKHKKENDERNELYRFYVNSVDIAKLTEPSEGTAGGIEQSAKE